MDSSDTESPSWHQRQRPLGPGTTYRLVDGTLEIASLRRTDRLKLADVDEVRFVYAPSNMSTKGFKTQLRLKNGLKAGFGNLSWRSLTEVTRDDAGYRAFVEALAAAVARANPSARFLAGKPRWHWLLLSVVSGLLLVMMAFFSLRGFMHGAAPAGWLGIAVMAASLWQVVPIVRLNHPRPLRTGEVPDALVPLPRPPAT